MYYSFYIYFLRKYKSLDSFYEIYWNTVLLKKMLGNLLVFVNPHVSTQISCKPLVFQIVFYEATNGLRGFF